MSGWISSKLKVAETLLQQIDQQAAESLRKNEASRSSDDLSHAIPKKTGEILPPLKDQLKKKKKTPSQPSPSLAAEKSDIVGKSRIDVNLKADGNAPNLNPKSSLTDSDWTELLSGPSKTSNGGMPRVSGLLKDGKRQVRSGSNLLNLDRKRSQAAVSTTARRSDVVITDKDKVIGDSLDGNLQSDSSASKSATVGVQVAAENLSSEILGKVASVIDEPNKELPAPDSKLQVKNEKNRSNSSMLQGNKISGAPITSSSKKTESLSASDAESNMETDSDSTSDSESEREREERRKRREKLLAEKAATKAIEAIKDHENLVARLEGEKQSLEKIIDERSKQQAQEASELQMTMMETMEAVDLEKQKHNNTRMEALMKLAKLETANAELAKSLANEQWSLEVEVKRVAELQRQIELKEASHKELTSKKKSHLTDNKLNALRGLEFEQEILEAEYTSLTDKVGQLHEKAMTLETAIQATRSEIENPTEVEVELKRRLSQLTDHLIQKQAQVEALSSEKAMLMFRIEAVSRSLEESGPSLKSPMNDIESGIWEVSNSRLQKGQKHVGSLIRQLDSIFWTGATFLRKNPMARIWSFVYLVFLHLWVLYIFRSHTAVPSEAGLSGAVTSLENINNTGA